MNIPDDLKYTTNDEWVRVEGNQATLGITDYAQDQLSDIVFVEFTFAIGDVFVQGEPFATVESVKAASDVYAPVSGTLLELNTALEDAPELINTDPYGAAWMAKIELTGPAELGTLLDAAAYQAYLQSRDH